MQRFRRYAELSREANTRFGEHTRMASGRRGADSTCTFCKPRQSRTGLPEVF